MGRKKKDSSVVFIGDDKEPLLQQTAWSPITSNGNKNNKSSQVNRRNDTSKSNNTLDRITTCPGSFTRYLFSKSSVIVRMLCSLCPPLGRFKRIAVDFEGSFLSTFILTATVYWGLVNKSKEGSRLIYLLHSLALTLGYLLVVSISTWTLALGTKTAITLRQIASILGYGLFGHAVVLLICEVGNDEWFMSLMTIIGGLDSFRICLILLSRTPVPACRFVLCTPVAIIHLLYLVYLHFAIMKA